MMRDALIIFKKELKNILKDKRTLFATVILPMILMPAIFVGIDSVSSYQQKDAQTTTYDIHFEGQITDAFHTILSGYISYQSIRDIEKYQEGSESDPLDNLLTVTFPADYKEGDKATVAIAFNSTSQKSSFAANMISRAVSEYSQILAEKKLKALGMDMDSLYTIESEKFDQASEQAQGAGFLAMMIPYMILIYVFAGAMGVGIDTTAGEKERGSLAVILVNQVSRSAIALGKIMYVLTVGIFSSTATFVGLMIAFSISGSSFGGNSASLAPGSIMILLVTLILMSALSASIIVFMGSLAKTVKEASSYIMPVYIIVVLTGVLTMNMDISGKLGLFLIPFVNGVFMMKAALMGEYFFLQAGLMLMIDIGLISVLLYGVTRLFNSERILYTV